MRTFSTVIITLLAVILVVLLAGVAFIYSGAYNVAASDEHASFVRSLLETAKDRSIRVNAQRATLTLPTDSASLRRGYQGYEEMCVVCHGAPGQERGWMGKGMNPQPPDLAESAEEFSSEEIFWVLRHGIKLAGMPALEATHDEQALLELTAFVEALPEMTEQEYRQLAPAESDTTTTDGHAGHIH